MKVAMHCGMPRVPVLRNALNCYEIKGAPSTQRYHGDGQAPIRDPMAGRGVAVAVPVVLQVEAVPAVATRCSRNCQQV